MKPVAPAFDVSTTTLNDAITYFGSKDLNGQNPVKCILCQGQVLPFKWMKRVERYDASRPIKGRIPGPHARTHAEEQKRRHTHFLGWSHGYHTWVNPALSTEWITRRLDVIDVSKEGVDNAFERAYNAAVETFAERVKAERKRRHLSQERFGYEFGVSLQTISQWELGKALPVSRIYTRRLEEMEAEEIKEATGV